MTPRHGKTQRMLIAKARVEAFEEAAKLAEAFIHNSVPADPKDDDEVTAKGRYSNGTVVRIAAALRARARETKP